MQIKKYLKISYYFIAFVIFSNLLSDEKNIFFRLILATMLVASLSYIVKTFKDSKK
ncbi:hypothetical protein [Peptoniphilus asaccharolyticus]